LNEQVARQKHKTKLNFPPIPVPGQEQGFEYDPDRDCLLFASDFAYIRGLARQYDGCKIFETIASMHLVEHDAAKTNVEKAQIRTKIAIEFNEATNGGWLFGLGRDRRMHRYSVDELLRCHKGEFKNTTRMACALRAFRDSKKVPRKEQPRDEQPGDEQPCNEQPRGEQPPGEQHCDGQPGDV